GGTSCTSRPRGPGLRAWSSPSCAHSPDGRDAGHGLGVADRASDRFCHCPLHEVLERGLRSLRLAGGEGEDGVPVEDCMRGTYGFRNALVSGQRHEVGSLLVEPGGRGDDSYGGIRAWEGGLGVRGAPLRGPVPTQPPLRGAPRTFRPGTCEDLALFVED